MSTISIITPLFNKKKYLPEMIESVLNQSFSDFELIIVDDGSTDGSGQIADEYSLKDSRICVIHTINGGVSKARNTGITLAQGKYITFIDADDTVSEEYLNNLYRCIIDNKVEIVISGITKVWKSSGNKLVITPPYQGRKIMSEVLDEFAEVQQKTGIYGFCAAKLFSQKLLGSTRFNEELQLAEDLDFYLNLYSGATTIFFNNDIGYFYFQETLNSPLTVADDKIDYYSQVLIQLHCADFLKKAGYYSNNNQRILDNTITKYMYLTLHFATEDTYAQKFLKLHRIFKQLNIKVSGKNFRQRLSIFLLKYNMSRVLWYMILLYRETRRLVRG